MIFVTRQMLFGVSIFLTISLVALACYYWREVNHECGSFSKAWFRSWIIRGLVAPTSVWIYLNIGSRPVVPPVLPQIAVMRGYSQWWEAFAAQACVGMMVLVTFWSALTFGWFMTGLLSAARNVDDILLAGFFWSPLLLPLAVGFSYLFGWTGLVLCLALGLVAFTHHTLTVIDTRIREPRYGGAIGKLKMGKYAEAEMAVISELEKCETHFDGWLLLAEIYALHFHDLPEAEKTIHELCRQPETGLSEFSIAMHRLADWHIQLRNDVEAARRAMEEICARMPGTHLAVMASHRKRQLAGADPDLDEHHHPRVIPMPKALGRLDQADDQRTGHPDRQTAQAAADACIEKLNLNPQDHAQRERLARIFVEELRQVDLGLEQMELLLELPDQPPEKVAERLSLLSLWLLRYRNDLEQGRRLLRRIVEEFPRTPHAFEAQRRLNMMEMEERVRRLRAPIGEAAQPAPSGVAAKR